MAEAESLAGRRALAVSAFSRLKELVRELEDNEKRFGRDFGPAEIEFKLNPDELAWFVAYRTSAESVQSRTTQLDQKR